MQIQNVGDDEGARVKSSRRAAVSAPFRSCLDILAGVAGECFESLAPDHLTNRVVVFLYLFANRRIVQIKLAAECTTDDVS